MKNKFGLLSPLLFFTCVQCFCVFIPLAVTEAYSFTTDGYEIFNVRTDFNENVDILYLTRVKVKHISPPPNLILNG